MRLLIKVKTVKDCRYEMQYHYHLQGFIYHLLNRSEYQTIHDKRGYKFFCFSNIFPVTANLKTGDLRNLLISSPDSNFIFSLEKSIKNLTNKEVVIGSMKFKIEQVTVIDTIIPIDSPFILITGTPIVIRIKREKYKQIGINPSMDYPFVFWKSNYPIELFMSQIKDNLLKKYRKFYHNNSNGKNGNTTYESFEEFFLFQKFSFRKQVSSKIIMKGT